MRRARPAAALAVLTCLAAGALAAAPIPKFVPPPPPEPSLESILDSIFGAGGYTLVDSIGSQTWPGGEVEITVFEAHTAATWRLGYCRLCDGSDLVLLTDLVLWEPRLFDLGPGDNVVWVNAAVLAVPPIVGTVHSANDLNPTSATHLLAFSVSGQPQTHALAFEDWLYTSTPGSDGDFNDLIFRVRYFRDEQVIPEPSTLALLCAGLLSLAALRRRRRV